MRIVPFALIKYLIAGIIFSAVPACWATGYQFNIIPGPDGALSAEVLGISGTNFSGWYAYPNGSVHGFIYNGVDYTTLDDPNAVQDQNSNGGTRAAGIDGDNVVGTYIDGSLTQHGFLYESGTYSTLDDPIGFATQPCAISGNKVVGYYSDGVLAHGFVYTNGTFSTIDEPNSGFGTYALGISGSNIVGYFVNKHNRAQGFLYNGATYAIVDYPGAADTAAYGVSGSDVVGFYVSRGGNHGFYFDGHRYTTMNVPMEPNATHPVAVQGSTVAGYYYYSGQATEGYIAALAPSPSAGKYTLLITSTNPGTTIPGGTGYATVALSAKGRVAIAGKLPDGQSFSSSGVIINPGGDQYEIFSHLSYPSPSQRGHYGTLSGLLNFITSGTSDVYGVLAWHKPPQSKGAYPAEIDTNLNVVGTTYNYARGESVLPGFTSGTLELSDTGALSLSGSKQLVKDVTLTSKNALMVTNPGPDLLKITVTASSGVFKGTFHYPGETKVSDFQGVLCQSGTVGNGFFVGPAGGGTVVLSP